MYQLFCNCCNNLECETILVTEEKTFQWWSEKTKYYDWVVMLCARPLELQNPSTLQTKVTVYCTFVFKVEIWWGTRLQHEGNFFTRVDIIASICRAWQWWAAKPAMSVGHQFAQFSSRTHDRTLTIRPKPFMPNNTRLKAIRSSLLLLVLPSAQP